MKPKLLKLLRAPLPTVMTCEAGTIKAPVHGEIVEQANIPDETLLQASWARRRHSAGEGIVVSPCAGTISTVAETYHAVDYNRQRDGDSDPYRC